jgi:ribosomal protein S6--L-glutamate ligase
VDVLETAAGPVLLEVNSSPGFQELEKSTRINVAEKMIAMAARKGAKKPGRRARKKL